MFHQKSQQQTEVDVNSSDIEGRSSTTSELLSQFSNDTMHHQNDLAWNDNVREFLEMRFANLTDYCIPAFLVGYFFFFTIGGYLHVSQKIMYVAKSRKFMGIFLILNFCHFFFNPEFLTFFLIPKFLIILFLNHELLIPFLNPEFLTIFFF